MRSFLALALLGVVLLAVQVPAAPTATQYAAGGTLVAKQPGLTAVDDGALVCSLSANAGVGGGCVPWSSAPGADALDVADASGEPVAFQVCIDNDGNGVCGGPQDPKCPDQLFFSHADGGRFFNPLGPLPTSFLRGCAGGFPGWVVFLCTGAHEEADATGAPGAPHAHAATTGTLTPTHGGTGYGDFCGGATGGAADPVGQARFAKAYVVQ